MIVDKTKILTWALQLVIGILVSLGLYILNDIKSDIHRVEDRLDLVIDNVEFKK